MEDYAEEAPVNIILTATTPSQSAIYILLTTLCFCIPLLPPIYP